MLDDCSTHEVSLLCRNIDVIIVTVCHNYLNVYQPVWRSQFTDQAFEVRFLAGGINFFLLKMYVRV
jgi:hypothetical protein